MHTMRETNLNFHTVCPNCQRLVKVLAIDGRFRWPVHQWGHRGLLLAGKDCSFSDTPWEG
jgi:hypothetical protein